MENPVVPLKLISLSRILVQCEGLVTDRYKLTNKDLGDNDVTLHIYQGVRIFYITIAKLKPLKR